MLLSADWTSATVEDTALIRRSIRENWPVEKGEAILIALGSALSPSERPVQVLRVASVAVEKRNLHRAYLALKSQRI